MAAKNRKLVIVESPAKARTISRFLGEGFDVEASVGHIRDLAQPSDLPEKLKKTGYSKFAVDLDNDFEPYYTVDAGKKKKVSELKSLLKNADELLLATDEDREGEAIAWHLLEVLQPKVPVKRMVFHEITADAIDRALHNPRELDTDLVNAQETRRILDRLVGYEVSPLLWRKIRTGLSAGRVQSVATRLVVERERERMGFIPAEYWDLVATLRPEVLTPAQSKYPESADFKASARSVNGARIATGKDFDDHGKLTAAAQKSSVRILSGADVAQLEKSLGNGNASWQVTEVESKPYRRRPPAPFTTSSLQQEASRKLRMNSRDTMRTAQTLYENGCITYMRTDSVNLSQQAISAARSLAASRYGKDSVPAKPRLYETKSKGAQEAHEAIRPAGDTFRLPSALAAQLNPAELKLYELIFKRTLASQMNDAIGTTVSVKIQARSRITTDQAEFATSGTVITEPGFLAAYEEGRDEESHHGENPEVPTSTTGTRLPQLHPNQELSLRNLDAGEDRQHFTTPPARYTDASLVKAMEERGIGRPSTYAATISTIVDRQYVNRRGQALVPTWLAFSVVKLLEENLPGLVDYDFTADMEADLDQIAAGAEDRTQWLKDFWFGSGKGSGLGAKGLAASVQELGDIDAAALNTVDLGEGVALRVGRYGPYLQRGEEHVSVPDDLAPDELTPEVVAKLWQEGAAGDHVLGVHPQTGLRIVAKNGRFGPYVEELQPEEAEGAGSAGSAGGAGAKSGSAKKRGKKVKNRTASLLKSQTLESLTLDDAVALLSIPRRVGADAEGVEIIAANGRFGPYIKRGDDTRSLASEEQLFTLTLAEALELLAAPKTRGRASGNAVILEFGEDPVSGKKVTLKNGRFGPYVTDGTTNATVPRGTDPATLTEAQAFELLEIKRAKGPAKRPARKTTAKKTSTKKASTKKASTKKASTKKASTKKTEE